MRAAMNPITRIASFVLTVATVVFGLATPSFAQAKCDGRWLTSVDQGVPGLNGPAIDLAVLPSGDIVVGGQFATAGGVTANRIARWDGASWSPLGSGMNGDVFTLEVLPNGDLVAGGDFTTAGGVTVNRIARWDGTSWAPFGSGMNGSVFGLVVLPNGDLVACGSFTTAGGVTENRIADRK